MQKLQLQKKLKLTAFISRTIKEKKYTFAVQNFSEEFAAIKLSLL